MTSKKVALIAAIFIGLPFRLAHAQSSNLQMQIVAHQDDDFLFMNPDLSNHLATGMPIVTVYVTAGEAMGIRSDLHPPGMCRDVFATARQRGVQAAYARMARRITGRDVPNVWTRELLVPDPDAPWPHTVERYTLNAFPQIQLIFMNIRDDGDELPRALHSLHHTFADPSYQVDTLVPSCEPAGSCGHVPTCGPDVPWQNYTHAEVVNVLSGLVDIYQPDIIRTLDPQPFERVGPPYSTTCPAPRFYDVCFDNWDHTATARYVDEVLANYHGPNGTSRYGVVHYKGYSFMDYPRNLGIEDYNRKREIGLVYRAYDYNYQDNNYDAFYRVMYERYPGSTTWVEAAQDGRLVAVSVEGREVKMWSEVTVGGDWTGPTTLEAAGPIAPHLTLLRRPDGLLQIFALHLPLERERWSPPTPPYQDVITAIQIPGTQSFDSWQSIGSPDQGQFVGVPTAVSDGRRLFAFAKNSEGKLAYAYANADDNIWSDWFVPNPYAQDIMDGIAAIRRDDGVVEAFATARSGRIQRFVQFGTYFILDVGFPFSGAASAPTVTKNRDGRLELFYREAQTGPEQYGRVLTSWVSPSGQWLGPSPLYGDAGVGPIAAIRRGGTGHIMIFERNVWGGLSMTREIDPNAAFILQWQILGGLVEEYAGVATDGLGRVVVLAKGADNRLYMRREASASAIGNFTAWTSIGY